MVHSDTKKKFVEPGSKIFNLPMKGMIKVFSLTYFSANYLLVFANIYLAGSLYTLF